MLISGQI